MPRHLPIRFQSSCFSLQSSNHRRALTLVELLIVLVVIGILVSAILVGGSTLIHKSRDTNTQSLLAVVAEAVEQFKRDQTARPTVSSATQLKQVGMGELAENTVSYVKRYDRYPPDELEVFTLRGLPGATPATARSLAPGGAAIVTNPTAPLPWGAMRFFNDGSQLDLIEHRDQLAMIVAIETLSESASAILDRIPDKNRTPGPLDAAGNPAIFLDRPDPTRPPTNQFNGTWDAGDLQIRRILDDWGNPISYLSQRDWKPPTGGYNPIMSTNHPGWNEASTELVRLNGGAPVIFSYGANGKDQLTSDAMTPNANASLVGDFEEAPPRPEHIIDNPLNDDNVYANPGLREKLAKGLQAP